MSELPQNMSEGAVANDSVTLLLNTDNVHTDNVHTDNVHTDDVPCLQFVVSNLDTYGRHRIFRNEILG